MVKGYCSLLQEQSEISLELCELEEIRKYLVSIKKGQELARVKTQPAAMRVISVSGDTPPKYSGPKYTPPKYVPSPRLRVMQQ